MEGRRCSRFWFCAKHLPVTHGLGAVSRNRSPRLIFYVCNPRRCRPSLSIRPLQRPHQRRRDDRRKLPIVPSRQEHHRLPTGLWHRGEPIIDANGDGHRHGVPVVPAPQGGPGPVAVVGHAFQDRADAGVGDRRAGGLEGQVGGQGQGHLAGQAAAWGQLPSAHGGGEGGEDQLGRRTVAGLKRVADRDLLGGPAEQGRGAGNVIELHDHLAGIDQLSAAVSQGQQAPQVAGADRILGSVGEGQGDQVGGQAGGGEGDLCAGAFEGDGWHQAVLTPGPWSGSSGGSSSW